MQFLGEQESTGEQLEEISFAASDAVKEARAIAYDLHPYQLNRFGLNKSTLGICAQAAESSGIKFLTDVESIDGLFEREVDKSIFRVIQEAMTSIIKHSQAEAAYLSVKQRGSELSILISGKRQEIRSAASSDGKAGWFGSVEIAERVRMPGGTYSLTSVPGEGTKIQIWLSLRGGL